MISIRFGFRHPPVRCDSSKALGKSLYQRRLYLLLSLQPYSFLHSSPSRALTRCNILCCGGREFINCLSQGEPFCCSCQLLPSAIMDSPNMNADMAQFFDFGKATMPAASRNDVGDVGVSTASPPKSGGCPAHGDENHDGLVFFDFKSLKTTRHHRKPIIHLIP